MNRNRKFWGSWLEVSSLVGLAFIVVSFVSTGEGDENGEITWNTDLSVAKNQAKEEGKLILLSFSGSDWCSSCIRLDRTLFQSEAFKTFAPEKFVLLNADFPMKKKNKLSDEQTAHNEKLANEFNSKGEFPTVIVLDADGVLVAKMKYPLKTAEEYIQNLEEIATAKN